MSAQIIYDQSGKNPEFAVIPWEEYQKLIQQESKYDEEMIPFDVGDFIDNPIKAMRIKANLTQVQLATALGVSQAYIGKIERSGHTPTEKLIKRVEKALNEWIKEHNSA